MDDITLNLIVLAVLAVIGGGVFLFFRSRQVRRKHDQLEAVRQRGWQVEDFKDDQRAGQRYGGETEGVTWTLETVLETTRAADYHGTDFNQTPETVWRTAGGALAEGLILLGQRQGNGAIPNPQTLGGLGGMIVQKALELMLGEDIRHLPGLKEVPLEGAIGQRFMLWAHDTERAQRLLSPALRSALAAWPDKYPLIVKLSQNGVHITVRNERIEDVAALQKLVLLGACLVNSI